MPRYHFHSADGARDVDQEGFELPDLAAARDQAVRYAGSVLKENPDEIWEKGHWRVEVTNKENALLFTVVTLAIDAPEPHEHPMAALTGA